MPRKLSRKGKVFTWDEAVELAGSEARVVEGVNYYTWKGWQNKRDVPAYRMAGLLLDRVRELEGRLPLRVVTAKEAADLLRQHATLYRAIPILQGEVAAGQPTDVSPDAWEEDLAIIFRQWGDETSFCFRIRGDSMEPKFHEGDIIGVQQWKRPAQELVNKYVALWLPDPPEHRGLTVKLLQRCPDVGYVGMPLNLAGHNRPILIGRTFDSVQLFKVCWWWGHQT